MALALLLCLLSWVPQTLAMSIGGGDAGWVPVCIGEGATTVLLVDSGSDAGQQAGRQCSMCWAQASERETPVLITAGAVIEVLAGFEDFPPRQDIILRPIFRFQIRSRAPPALA